VEVECSSPKNDFLWMEADMYFYADDVVKKLKNSRQLVAFGAGSVPRLIVHCLLNGPYHLPVAYCMVSELQGNPEQVEGLPVIDYTAAEILVHKDALILAGVMERHLNSIVDGLHQHGYTNILPLTYEDDLWSLLRGNCYRDSRLLQGKSYLTVEEELQKMRTCVGTGGKTVSVYRACSHMDKELQEDVSRYAWEVPIQVGAALTEKHICRIRDDTGEQISGKNRQYCELTALYWIWKNDRSDYVGLGHYRRHFELDERQLRKLACSDIDVVLTIPIMDYPNVGAVYRRDHVGEDWDVMLEAVQKICPEYLASVVEMQDGQFYYAYNMFIMRREILEAYCAWLFPVLAYCESHCKKRDDDYQGRYIGFLAEHLMSAYFLYHENEYKIVHARKHFIW